MTKKWIAINLLLLAVAALLGWELRLSVLQFNAENNLAKIQPVADLKNKIVQEKLLPKLAPVKAYNPADFSIVADKNIFSDSRTKEEKVENTAPPEPPPLTQKPILVGVTITDTTRQASIIDPTVREERNRRAQAQIKRIGDVYQGYTITEISPERIVLESGSRREVIPIHEGSKRKDSGKTPILSTRIVPFGAGTIAGGTAVSIGSTSAAAPSRGTSTTVVTSGPNVTNTTVTTSPSGAAQPAARTTSATGTAQPAPTAAPATNAAPGTRIIRTPFGDIVRPVR